MKLTRRRAEGPSEPPEARDGPQVPPQAREAKGSTTEALGDTFGGPGRPSDRLLEPSGGRPVAVFGKMDENGLSFEVFTDGRRIQHARNPRKPPKDIWEASTKRFGKGRLLFFRLLANDLEPGPHTLEVRPVFPENGKNGHLRIESVMFAGGA